MENENHIASNRKKKDTSSVEKQEDPSPVINYQTLYEEVKAYIIIGFDNFTPSMNTEFRDNTISFDVICHTDHWSTGSFTLRPLQICGYIDGMLNKQKMSGIGELQFLSCNELILDENLSGYTLTYIATHGSDDIIPDGI